MVLPWDGSGTDAWTHCAPMHFAASEFAGVGLASTAAAADIPRLLNPQAEPYAVGHCPNQLGQGLAQSLDAAWSKELPRVVFQKGSRIVRWFGLRRSLLRFGSGGGGGLSPRGKGSPSSD